jgi:hypothetical protein
MSSHVRHGEVTHERGERRRVARAKHQVPVIGPQTPAQQPDRIPSHGFGEDDRECEIIRLFMEQSLAAVAPIEDMNANVRLDPTRGTWHARKYIRERAVIKGSDPFMTPDERERS